MSDPDQSRDVNGIPWVDPETVADREIYDADDLLAEDDDYDDDEDIELARGAAADASPYDDYNDAALVDDPDVEPNLVRLGPDDDDDASPPAEK